MFPHNYSDTQFNNEKSCSVKIYSNYCIKWHVESFKKFIISNKHQAILTINLSKVNTFLQTNVNTLR